MADGVFRAAPGSVRDAIFDIFRSSANEPLSVVEIELGVIDLLGGVNSSSVRSYLNLNTPRVFERTKRGFYRLRQPDLPLTCAKSARPAFASGKAKMFAGDCFDIIQGWPSNSIHAVVTDPPYGLVEFSEKEVAKLRAGKGGVWRIPPSFDGAKRSPLPRFTVLGAAEMRQLDTFFADFASSIVRVLTPGANVLIASNPLLAHQVAVALSRGGLEARGTIVRLVMTMRGGDRPKNAHEEFAGVSVMPRSMWEPWLCFRKPLEGRVQDNLRTWGVGGFRRLSHDKPFGDVIESSPTRAAERALAPHPSLKPQAFLRRVVRGSLALGKGILLDPFAGSGSTLAAANSVGYESIGIEKDAAFVALARSAIPALEALDSPTRSARAGPKSAKPKHRKR